jgi:hypothetical protein
MVEAHSRSEAYSTHKRQKHHENRLPLGLFLTFSGDGGLWSEARHSPHEIIRTDIK